MLDIGFYIPVLKNNTKDYNLLLIINAIAKHHTTTLFNSHLSTQINYSQSFVTLPCKEAKYYTGSLVVNDIQSVSIIGNFPCPKNKIFLIDDIFWQNKSIPYKFYHSLYYNGDIKFVSTNNKIRSLLTICFNNSDDHIEDVSSIEGIKNVIEKICQS